MHLLFSLLNVYVFSEVHTKNGRADAIIIHDKQIYCLEFKLDQSADIALEQIKSRGYDERNRLVTFKSYSSGNRVILMEYIYTNDNKKPVIIKETRASHVISHELELEFRTDWYTKHTQQWPLVLGDSM